jgi:hypothetical protein
LWCKCCINLIAVTAVDVVNYSPRGFVTGFLQSCFRVSHTTLIQRQLKREEATAVSVTHNRKHPTKIIFLTAVYA